MFLLPSEILHSELPLYTDTFCHLLKEHCTLADISLPYKKEFDELQGLIYFTDGDGIYPAKATEYETAFVFLEKNEHMEKVPKWALGLVTDQRGRKRK